MKTFHHICCNCGVADMQYGTRTLTAQLHGLHLEVPGIIGWHCPNCGEGEFADEQGASRYAAALQELQIRNRASLARIRKKLKLTQGQAAELTGGGHNAFSRYERGTAKPMAAVVNLFRLLDKHPDLLKELRG